MSAKENETDATPKSSSLSHERRASCARRPSQPSAAAARMPHPTRLNVRPQHARTSRFVTVSLAKVDSTLSAVMQPPRLDNETGCSLDVWSTGQTAPWLTSLAAVAETPPPTASPPSQPPASPPSQPPALLLSTPQDLSLLKPPARPLTKPAISPIASTSPPPPADPTAPSSTVCWTISDLLGRSISLPRLASDAAPTQREIALMWSIPEDAFRAVPTGTSTIFVVRRLRGGAGTPGSGRRKGGTSVGSGRKREPWLESQLANGDVLYTHPRYENCMLQAPATLQGKALFDLQDERRAKHLRDLRRSAAAVSEPASLASSHTNERGATNEAATPVTTVKPPLKPQLKRGRGRSPNGKRFDPNDPASDEKGWVDCPKAAERHAARAAKKKAEREAKGLRGPGRPSLPPREATAEAKGTAVDVPIKEKSRAVLSSFMREHEAIAEQQPEQSARAALRLEEPGDESAQQVHVIQRVTQRSVSQRSVLQCNVSRSVASRNVTSRNVTSRNVTSRSVTSRAVSRHAT